MIPSPQLLIEIAASLATITSAEPASAGSRWGAMHKLLLKAKVDPKVIMRLVGTRDLPALTKVVAQLRGEAVADEPPPPVVEVAAIDPSILKSALKVFRRRLKFSQLDAESRLGVGPMSSGVDRRIDSMLPPGDFPMAVWDALVADGKLHRDRDGYYGIIEDNSHIKW
ncbi:MAG: hypothetical protein O2800_07025 [Planctomycetota bacterium]|nr:hypothetical protein [Planctomycetota bacterium]